MAGDGGVAGLTGLAGEAGVTGLAGEGGVAGLAATGLGALAAVVRHRYLTPRTMSAASPVRLCTTPGRARNTPPASITVMRILSGKPIA